MFGIKLISVNVEESKHLDRLVPFIERERPDVLCAMEVAERDIPRFERIAGKCLAFAPIVMHHATAPEMELIAIGTAVFTRCSASSVQTKYYRGDEELAREPSVKQVTEAINLIRCDIEKGGVQFRILATHFTWTPDGKPSEQQRIDLRALCAYLDTCGEFVLCGDFNAPRGGEIFSALAAKYKDNIPLEYESSIDMQLHRAAHLRAEEMGTKMVDGLFTTPSYAASEVHLVHGVSDHKAVVAHIQFI